MRVAILSSGGKDSAYASWWAMMQGWEIVSLVTVGIDNDDSMMFQIQGTYISAFQSISMGIPWLPVESLGKEELEVSDLEDALQGNRDNFAAYENIWPENIPKHDEIEISSGKIKIDALVTGALRSDYQKTRIEMMCERLGIISFCPLWHKNPKEHMEALIKHGFEIKFVSVSSDGLDETWLGKTLTGTNLIQLHNLSKKYRFNLDGEGGEFETIALDGPHMKKRIKCQGQSNFKSGRGIWTIQTVDIEEG